MLCPECGEAVGSGPLSVRCAKHLNEDDSHEDDGGNVVEEPPRGIRALWHRLKRSDPQAGDTRTK